MKLEPIRIEEPKYPLALKRLEDLRQPIKYLTREEAEAIYPKEARNG
jgi:hypothetical protein